MVFSCVKIASVSHYNLSRTAHVLCWGSSAVLGTLLVARQGSSAPKGLGSWRTWGGGAVSRPIPEPQAKLTLSLHGLFWEGVLSG